MRLEQWSDFGRGCTHSEECCLADGEQIRSSLRKHLLHRQILVKAHPDQLIAVGSSGPVGLETLGPQYTRQVICRSAFLLFQLKCCSEVGASAVRSEP